MSNFKRGDRVRHTAGGTAEYVGPVNGNLTKHTVLLGDGTTQFWYVGNILPVRKCVFDVDIDFTSDDTVIDVQTTEGGDVVRFCVVQDPDAPGGAALELVE